MTRAWVAQTRLDGTVTEWHEILYRNREGLFMALAHVIIALGFHGVLGSAWFASLSRNFPFHVSYIIFTITRSRFSPRSCLLRLPTRWAHVLRQVLYYLPSPVFLPPSSHLSPLPSVCDPFALRNLLQL